MIKYKYRIKTEQEFLSEFGSNWRNVRCSFINNMDHLLGTEIDQKYYINYIEGEGRLLLKSSLVFHFYGWNISDQMIKEVRLGIDYNEKRILVYD